jgi:LexA-binding, inner membrane-associated putative hydrolase
LTHFIGSWLVASVTTDNPRDRKLVTLAGVLPDLDGLGLVADVAIATISGQPNHYHYYQQYHHYLAHGWPGALVVGAVLTLFARNRRRTLLLCLVTFHLHLFCDLLGSRGPTVSDLWPIAYSEPLFRHPVWFWKGQWKLDGWQNQIIFVVVFATSLWRATRMGHSFVELFSRRADTVFVGVLRKWRDALTQTRVGGPP